MTAKILPRRRGLSALSEQAFCAGRRAEWDALEALLLRPRRRWTAADAASLSPLYRDVTADLSRATTAGYSAELTAYLASLSARSHTAMYARPSLRGRRSIGDWIALFPRAIRRHRGAMLAATALFFGPFALGLLATLHDPTLAYRVAPRETLDALADTYRQGFSHGRGLGQDVMMAGFYVNNNVGIALRCFALGLPFGVGSAIYLAYNGLATGAIMGYVTANGAGGNILTFVLGHGTFELGAIVIAGGAGLAMGWSLVAPGPRTRIASLRATAPDLAVLIVGAAIMLFGAAAIEGFWSGSAIPDAVKRTIGTVLFVTILGYIGFGGRRR